MREETIVLAWTRNTTAGLPIGQPGLCLCLGDGEEGVYVLDKGKAGRLGKVGRDMPLARLK
ncbi:MAG: hypothetical protein D6722_15195, partial [Bacteroidetes bacterium]